MRRSYRVRSLTIYPIKSAGGIDVGRAEVTARGLAWDRRWMVVDAEGRFVSQRQQPRMALIRVGLRAGQLEVTAPDMPHLTIPVGAVGAERGVRVWSDECEARSLGPEVAAWFTRFLGDDAELVFMPESTVRAVDPAFGRPGDQVSFADGYPLLLANEASLDDLNRRLVVPVAMRRFRPNVVVTGCGPFDEDRWHRLEIGDVSFRVAKPCGRCKVVTLDPETGEHGTEPLRTLSSYRRRAGSVVFGQNLIPDVEGRIAVGDAVRVVEGVTGG